MPEAVIEEVEVITEDAKPAEAQVEWLVLQLSSV